MHADGTDLTPPPLGIAPPPTVNWSDELEEFHEETSRDHVLEVQTRRLMIDRVGRLPSTPTVVDLGCSTGYLLDDISGAWPKGRWVGIDLVLSGLIKAHRVVPGATVVQADACRIPLPDGSVDALLSANLFEHIPDDEAALREVSRVLGSDGVAVIVVPAGRGLYDYYDRFLHHERRYGRGELASKASSVGLRVEEDTHFGSSVYPAFWAVKKLNRLRFGHLEGDQLEAKVREDYTGTQDSAMFRLACGADDWFLRHRFSLPVGIRDLVVMRPS